MTHPLIEGLQGYLGCDMIEFHPPHVWLMKMKKSGMLLKIEATAQQDRLLINVGFARDGSGPLRANFLSTLMVEDIHATSSSPIGVCGGAASVTIYHILNISGMDVMQLYTALLNFEELTGWIYSSLVEDVCLLPVRYDDASVTNF